MESPLRSRSDSHGNVSTIAGWKSLVMILTNRLVVDDENSLMCFDEE